MTRENGEKSVENDEIIVITWDYDAAPDSSGFYEYSRGRYPSVGTATRRWEHLEYDEAACPMGAAIFKNGEFIKGFGLYSSSWTRRDTSYGILLFHEDEVGTIRFLILERREGLGIPNSHACGMDSSLDAALHALEYETDLRPQAIYCDRGSLVSEFEIERNGKRSKRRIEYTLGSVEELPETDHSFTETLWFTLKELRETEASPELLKVVREAHSLIPTL